MILMTIMHVCRTFARDHLEAVYVQAMANAFDELPVIDSMHRVPLFSTLDSVLGRWWNAYHLRPAFLQEANMCVVHRIMVPHDSPEVNWNDYNALRHLYPRTPDWYRPHWFPHAVQYPYPRRLPSSTST